MNLWETLWNLAPWSWAQYDFMRVALLGALVMAPLFALLGCVVVNHRLAFFSEAVGHAALTGIAIGVLAGLANPLGAMLLFAALLALAVTLLRRWSAASSDTIIGLLMAAAVAAGVVLLSRGGGFAKYTRYLIGDILTLTYADVGGLALLLLLVLAGWVWGYNRLFLVGVCRTLARSRGIAPDATESVFTLLVALAVTVSLQWVGLLVINAMLLLPAAAARNLARSASAYVGVAVAVALISSVTGLLLSYYANTAAGATMALVAAGIYALSLVFRRAAAGG